MKLKDHHIKFKKTNEQILGEFNSRVSHKSKKSFKADEIKRS